MSHPSLASLFSVSPFLLAVGFGALSCKKDVIPPSAPPAPVAPSPPVPAAYAPRVQVTVTQEGFVPARIPARAGQPLTLVITRTTEKTCANEIMFRGQDGQTDLPLNKPVEVTYVPKVTGEVKFGCAMGMMIGGVLDVQ